MLIWSVMSAHEADCHHTTIVNIIADPILHLVLSPTREISRAERGRLEPGVLHARYKQTLSVRERLHF